MALDPLIADLIRVLARADARRDDKVARRGVENEAKPTGIEPRPKKG